MVLAAIGIGAAGIGASAAEGGISSAIQYKYYKKMHRFDRAAMSKDRVAEVQALEDAGLNRALMYGKGPQGLHSGSMPAAPNMKGGQETVQRALTASTERDIIAATKKRSEAEASSAVHNVKAAKWNATAAEQSFNNLVTQGGVIANSQMAGSAEAMRGMLLANYYATGEGSKVPGKIAGWSPWAQKAIIARDAAMAANQATSALFQPVKALGRMFPGKKGKIPHAGQSGSRR